LKYTKNKGIIHCDLKPENILFIDESWADIKIIDFGASCENFESGFTYIQSRAYRAPEVVLGIPYSHPIDMWAVGCILFEIIMDQQLFYPYDENQLMEEYYVTLGEIPQAMLDKSQKYS